MNFLVEHRINNALSRNPFALDKSFVESTRVKAFVASDNLLGQRRIVTHCEVKIKAVLLFCLENPFTVEPVHRMLRVAVEPQL